MDDANGVSLGEIRKGLKVEIEKSKTLGSTLYEVWIDATASTSAESDAWEKCIQEARECDIFLMLYNGNAGWEGTAGNASTGICHAEFQAAYDAAPSKVVIVDIFEPTSSLAPSKARHTKFQARIRQEGLWGNRVSNTADLKEAVRNAIVTRTIELVQKGIKSARQGRGYIGPALEWKRLSYVDRKARMTEAVTSALPGGVRSEGTVTVKLEEKAILCKATAVPDALSVSAARELVGQPHLSDHTSVEALKKAYGGPVHLIACARSATAAHAQRMLGFPNATIVPAPFGVYAADPVQAIQFVLISDCSDEYATGLAVQRFMEWLPQSGQLPLLLLTAKKRKDIVSLLAREP